MGTNWVCQDLCLYMSVCPVYMVQSLSLSPPNLLYFLKGKVVPFCKVTMLRVISACSSWGHLPGVHRNPLQQFVLYFTLIPWRHWPSTSWGSTESWWVPEALSVLRVKFQGTDITDDSSAFSLSRFRQCLWPWKPKGTKGPWWYSCSTKVAVGAGAKWDCQGILQDWKGP